jgi:hypothetical protein
MCRGQTFDDCVAILESTTLGVCFVAAIVAGIRYGAQDKDYWT